ncbi:MAG: alpha/beta fold hydrolase [Acetobacteraceae bacterium]|nr:alpha/beta fold hydrolase [Acetobacteraceae bacterium]
MRLVVTEMGEGPPVLLLHGLFGQGRNWATIQKRLAARHRVLAPDLRNHGTSPQAAGMTYAAMAEDVAETMQSRGLAGAAVIGHSMGGKVAMALALRRPGLVSRLLVADMAPRRYAPALRPYVAAMRALPLTPGLTRKEADAALAPAVPEAGIRAFLLQNLDVQGEAPRWTLGLAGIAAGMPDIEDFAETGRYEGPTLFLSGGRSPYVTDADRPAILALFPRARFARIEAAGHWVHAEQPDAFTALAMEFLA